MTNKEVKDVEEKNPSMAENLGNITINASKKLGNAAISFMFGKQPSKEEKEERMKEAEHRKQCMKIQNEARRKQELELAKQGRYVPPQKLQKQQKKEENIFSNLGKHNPLEGFNDHNSLGSNDNFGMSGIGVNKNPLGDNKRREY